MSYKILLIAGIFMIGCTSASTQEQQVEEPTQEVQNNILTQDEKDAGWKLLFDGKTTAGWRNFNKDSIGSAWKVEDGALTLDVSKMEGWQVIGGGDIISSESFENYEFMLDWRLEEGGNSGIIYNVIEDAKYKYPWETGPEMQALDNERHDDAKIRKHRAGDLYDMIECEVETVKPAMEWNAVKLVNNDGKIEHWLNGTKVVTYDMNQDSWQELIDGSKFRDMADFGQSKSGHIGLQDHGNRVWFRNIKIRKL